MDDQVRRLRRWASHASLPRLYTELALHLAGDGYEMELQGEEVTIFGQRRPPGLKGWFRKPDRVALLRLVRQGGQVTVPDEPADPDFVSYLLERLKM